MKQADEPDGTPLDRERVQDLGEPPVDRRKLIQDALACRPRPISAHTYVRRWETSSKPVALLCDDGQAYITKARQNGKPEMSRVMITDGSRSAGCPARCVRFKGSSGSGVG